MSRALAADPAGAPGQHAGHPRRPAGAGGRQGRARGGIEGRPVPRAPAAPGARGGRDGRRPEPVREPKPAPRACAEKPPPSRPRAAGRRSWPRTRRPGIGATHGRKPAPAPAEERRPRADGEDPDLPANIPQDLYCPVPDQTPPDEPLTLRCVLRPGVRAGRLTLHYRPGGQRELHRRAHGPLAQGLVPGRGAGVSGDRQVAAVLRRGHRRPQLTQWQLRQPEPGHGARGRRPGRRGHLAAVAGREDDEPPTIEDENPLAEIEKERAREGVHVRRSGGCGRGWGWARAYGWQRGRTAGVPGGSGGGCRDAGRAAWCSCCPRSATSGTSGWRSRCSCASSSSPPKVRAIPPRASRRRGPSPPWPERPTPSATATCAASAALAVGGGDGFRLKVSPSRQTGLVRSDTVRGGPFLAGAGGGVVYHFNPHVAWPTELRALAGVPDIALRWN